MLKKIVIICLLTIPYSLFGTNWANEFPLYIYGDVSFIATIYEFINSVVDDDAVEVIVELGMVITAFIGGLKLKDGDFEGFSKNIIAPITLLALFFTPSVDVHITDIRVDKGYIDHTLSPDGGYQKVEKVPYAIAFLPASAMLLVNLTVDLIDNNWASVHIANKFSAMGFQELSGAIRDVLKTEGFIVDNNTSKYSYDLNTYIKECIVGTAITYNKNIDFAKAPNVPFPDNLNPTNFPYDFSDDEIDYEDYDNVSHNNVKCSTAYNDLVVTNKDKILEACETKIKTLFPTKDLTSASASEAFRQQIGDTSNVVGTLKKAVATTVTAQFYQKQKSLDAVGVDGYSVATELSIQTTLANMRSEGPAKFEWIAKTLPDAILIISGIFIAAFPLLIIVQSFMGANAFTAIANYFMGFFAFYFNFVGLALVQNVISFFTSQEAQQTIAMSMNMPFSAQHLPAFLMQQADLAGMAGMIGAASVVAVTPLIFYGESKGFASAMGAVTGAFRGGIDATSNDTLKNSELETEIDRQLLEETRGMTEQEAGAWLEAGGFQKRSNMTSLDTYNQIQRGYSQIGAGLTAKDLVHSGNVNDYIEGSYLASTQQTMKTVGMGNAIDSVQNAGEVSMQDGMVMAESINATDRMRNFDKTIGERELGINYDTSAIGTGMAVQQFAKDKGMEYIGSNIENDNEKYDNNLASINKMSDIAQNVNSQLLDAINNNAQSALTTNAMNAENEKDDVVSKSTQELSDTLEHIKNDTGLNAALNKMEQENNSYTKQSDDIQARKEQLDKDFGKEPTLTQEQKELNTLMGVVPKADENSIFNGNELSMLSTSPRMDDYIKQQNALDVEQAQLDQTHQKNQDNIQSEINDKVADASFLSNIAREENIQKTNTALDNIDANKLEQDNIINNNKDIALAKNKQDSKDIEANRLSNIEKLSSDSDTVSSLVASSVNQSVQQIASGQGLIDSMAFNNDGSFNDTGSQGKILETGYYNQSRISANKTMGMGKEDITSDQMLSVQASSHAGMLSEFAEGKILRDNFGNNLQDKGSYASSLITNQDEIDNAKEHNRPLDEKIQSLTKKRDALVDKAYQTNDDKKMESFLNQADNFDAKIHNIQSQKQTVPQAKIDITGEKEEISFTDMISNEATNKLAGRMGSAKAFDDIGFDIAASNAQFGATSQALSTATKIATQGGVEKAVATDVAEASMKAAMQQGATQGQIEELAKKSGMNDESAKLFSKEIINGSQEASELIKKGITDASKDLSSSMSASKTGSDIRAIDIAGGHDAFVQLGKDQSSLKTAQSITSVDAAKSANFLNDSGITDEGMQAYGIQAGEAASILGVKRDVFFGDKAKENMSKIRKGLYDKGIEAHMANGKTKVEAESIMDSALQSVGFTQDAQGQDAINALAKMGAMNYASSKTLSAGGVQFNMGIGADGNMRIGEATAQESIKGGKQMDTGANLRSAMQAFVTSGGDENDTQGFINYVKNSQLSDAHKKNIFGHVTAGVANAMNIEQHDAEQLVAAGGAALGMIGLNSLVGNPIGKVTSIFKNTTQKLLGKNTLEDANYSSNNKYTSDTLNNTIDNGKTSNMNHNISPSDEIKSSRKNLSKYTQEYGEIQQKRVDLEDKFNYDDRNGKMTAKQRVSRFKEIDNLKIQSEELSYKMQAESNNIAKNKAYMQYQDNLLKGNIADNAIGKPFNAGNINPIHEANGRIVVDGIDPKGNEKTFRVDNTNSRNSYLRHNTGAHSVLPDIPNSTSSFKNVLNYGGKVLQKGGIAATVDQAGGVAFDIFSAVQKTGQNFYKTGNLDFTPIQKAVTAIPATIATGALDLANMAGSTVNAAYHSTFGKPTFGQAFETSFENAASTYKSISQYASSGMTSQILNSGMQNGNTSYVKSQNVFQTNHNEQIADTGTDTMQYVADTSIAIDELAQTMAKMAQKDER